MHGFIPGPVKCLHTLLLLCMVDFWIFYKRACKLKRLLYVFQNQCLEYASVHIVTYAVFLVGSYTSLIENKIFLERPFLKGTDVLICRWRPLLHVIHWEGILFIYCCNAIVTCGQICKEAQWPRGKGIRLEILLLALPFIYCVIVSELLPLVNDCL